MSKNFKVTVIIESDEDIQTVVFPAVSSIPKFDIDWADTKNDLMTYGPFKDRVSDIRGVMLTLHEVEKDTDGIGVFYSNEVVRKEVSDG